MKYELNRSMENGNFLIYLFNKAEEELYNKYISSNKKGLKKVKVKSIIWSEIDDLQQLPEILDSLLVE